MPLCSKYSCGGGKTGRGSELCREMHARETGRRSNVGEACRLDETGLDILDRFIRPSASSVRRARLAETNESCNNVDADAVGVALSVGLAELFCDAERTREPLRVEPRVSSGRV